MPDTGARQTATGSYLLLVSCIATPQKNRDDDKVALWLVPFRQTPHCFHDRQVKPLGLLDEDHVEKANGRLRMRTRASLHDTNLSRTIPSTVWLPCH